MSRTYIKAIILGIGFGMFSLILLDNLIVALIMALSCVFFLVKFIYPSVNIAKEYEMKLDELHAFTNSLSMQLLSTPSIHESVKICKDYYKPKVKEIYQSYSENIDDFLVSLKDFFNNKSYDVFYELLLIYENSGGDIKATTNAIISDVAFKKESAENLFKIKKRKIGEFLTMWAFAFVSLLYLRVGLSSYYVSMLEDSLGLAVIAVLLLFLFSVTKAFIDLRSINYEGKL